MAAHAAVPVEAGLHLLFDLGTFVGAVAISSVERAFPGTEIELVVRVPSTPSSPLSVPAKDLARELGTSVATRTWLILHPTAGRPFRAALGVGASFGARPIGDVMPLPPGIFAVATPIVAMFRLEEAAGSFDRGRLGLVIAATTLLDGDGWTSGSVGLQPRGPHEATAP